MPVEVKPLFRPDVVRQRLQNFALPARVEENRQCLTHWAELLVSSQAERLKEQELLPDFLTDIFTTLLGYQRPADNPNRYTISREKHVEVDGKFADAVLGLFGGNDERFVIAVEGKGPTDPLDRPYKSRPMSAVDQGYRYAINLPCDWIIVTSMRETRLYCKATDQLTYERFHIADMAANEYVLKRFVFLLGADRVVPPSGICHLDELRAASEKTGRELTKEFYVRYADMREDVFEQLCASNPERSRHDILSATQKILDRVLFCAFCEDRGLLPSQTLSSAFQHRDPYNPRPIWDNFRGLFRSIDTGNEPLHIPPYNGGLFSRDDFLETLAVPMRSANTLKTSATTTTAPASKCSKTPTTPTKATSLTWTSWGTSLNNPLVTSNNCGMNSMALLRRRAKRHTQVGEKKEGAFYTPAFVTRYIVDQAVGGMLSNRFEELRQTLERQAAGTAHAILADPKAYDLDVLNRTQRSALTDFWQAWQDDLASVRILDPACGSGAFLIEAFDRLHSEFQASNDRLQELRGHRTLFDLDRQILQNNLYGVDLNEEAIQICRLSLWIKTAEAGKQLTSLDRTIRVGNSVIDDPGVHPLALNWASAFPEVAEAGGFDVVIANPPYIRQEWISQYKPYWQRTFKSYHGAADIYVYFYERGLQLLRPGGLLSFVVTNKWMRSNYGMPLRTFLHDHAWLLSVVDFGHAKQIFEQADVFPSIIVAQRPSDGPPPTKTRVCAIPREHLRTDSLFQQIHSAGFLIDRDHLGPDAWQLESPDVTALMQKVQNQGVPLSTFASAHPLRGILTGLNDAFVVNTAQRDRLVESDPTCERFLRPFLRGQDNGRWSCRYADVWLIAIPSSGDQPHPWSDAGERAERVFADTHPALSAHLTPFRDALIKRQDKGRFFWELRSCGYWDVFIKPKIVYQEIQFHPWYALDLLGRVVNNKCFVIPTADRWLLAVLNSPVMWWHNWRYLPHMKDEALSPVAFRMEGLPIAVPTDDIRSIVESAVGRLIQIASNHFQMCNQVKDWLIVEHEIQDIGVKLADPAKLDDDQFAGEVKKRRGKARPLSIAGLQAIREQHMRAIAPVRTMLVEAKNLEKRVSDCVCRAYALTPQETDLIWQTAPPRMPVQSR